MNARCTCGETACESELCDCDKTPCPVDHAFEAEVLREAAERIRRELPNTPCTDDYEFVRTAAEAADLIDPDKENSADGTEVDRA